MIQVSPSDALMHKLEADLFGPLTLEASSLGTTYMDGYTDKHFTFSDSDGGEVEVWESRWYEIKYVAYGQGQEYRFTL